MFDILWTHLACVLHLLVGAIVDVAVCGVARVVLHYARNVFVLSVCTPVASTVDVIAVVITLIFDRQICPNLLKLLCLYLTIPERNTTY